MAIGADSIGPHRVEGNQQDIRSINSKLCGIGAAPLRSYRSSIDKPRVKRRPEEESPSPSGIRPGQESTRHRESRGDQDERREERDSTNAHATNRAHPNLRYLRRFHTLPNANSHWNRQRPRLAEPLSRQLGSPRDCWRLHSFLEIGV